MVDSSGGFYQRFTLSDSKSNSLSFLLPSSENEEYISDIKQPSLSSVNLTDSVGSSSVCSNHFNNDIGDNHLDLIKDAGDFSGIDRHNVPAFDNGLCNSEPEDMQEYHKSFLENCVPRTNGSLFKPINIRNDKLENNYSLNESIEPLINYRKTCTSSPLSFSHRKMSFSLQDVSAIDIFPLESKTANAFSTETIPSQSMSSTTKSKDSGFQRSASCLSLNSGNRSYEHVPSKVKQYIKEIKESEAVRKKEKRQKNALLGIPKIKSDQKDSTTSDFGKSELIDMNKTISLLKVELEEKNTILNELQLNYNQLLKKYAEAVNQIDLMRLRTSLNYSSHHSEGYSDLNSDVFVNNCSNNINSSLLNNSNSFLSDKFNSSDLPKRSRQDLDCGSGCDNKFNVDELVTFDKSDSLHNVSVSCDNNCDVLYSKTDRSSHKKCDMLLKDLLLQPGSHSTPVSSIKSVTLRPISRMYSSSSRLDRKVPPLPSSSLNNKSNDNLLGCLNCNNNDKIDFKDDKSGTLIAGDDDVSVPYLDSRSISQLELPKVDPFDKVKKWQASLPTISLIRSQSSSSVGSYDDTQMKPHFASSTTKLDNSGQSKELKNLNKSKRKQIDISKLNNSKSDLDITSNKSPRIYSEYYDINISSNNFESRANVNINHGKDVNRSHKHILIRCDAIDSDTFGNNVFHGHSENVSPGPFSLVRNEHQTVLDDSSSMSSSILSSNKDKEINYSVNVENNKMKSLRGNIKTDKKISSSTNHKKVDSKRRSFSFFDDKNSSKVDSVLNKAKSLTQINHQSDNDSDTNKKRVCFKKLNKVYESKKPLQRTAWDGPKQNTDFSKSDLKTSTINSVPFRNKQNLIVQRTEKLKSFTEILSYSANSSINVRKESLDVGTQVSDDLKECVAKENHPSSPLQYEDHLKEADIYVKHLIREMKRIHGILEGLQVSSTTELQS